MEGEHGPAVIATVVRRLNEIHLGKGDLRLAAPRQVLIGAHRAAEMLEAERVDGVRPASGVEDEAREHRVVGHAAQLHPRPRSTCQSYLMLCPAFGTAGSSRSARSGSHPAS